jgi:hypothetical protein
MPTVADLERLEALIERLQPLALKQRGELIAAADWNVAVGALIEIGRAALATDDSDTIPPHEHTDQVGIGWLDPRVRQLLTGGGVKDPAVDAEFRKLRRDLTGLTGRLDRVGADVATSRALLNEVATNDLVRAAAVTRLDRKVLGAAEGREDIADLRATLRTLETEVGRAVEVGALLEADGQTIDVPALVERVTAVEVLRDRLTRPDGELLDAASLERRLIELQGSLVTADTLTETLADLRDDIRGGGLDLDTVLDAARGAGREAATGSVDTLATELRSTISARFGEIDATVEAAVSRSTTAVVDSVLGTVRSEIDQAVGSGDADVRAALEAALDQRIAATTRLVDERLSAISDGVSNQVATELDTRLTATLGALNTRLDGIAGSVGELAARATGNESAIAELDTRLEAGLRADATARAATRAELLERIAAVETGLDPRITAAVDAARSVLRTDLEATVGAVRRDLEGSLERAAREAAATEVQVLSTSVRTDVQSVIRQEIDATMGVLREEISAEVAGLQQRVAGLVANEVTRVSADIPRLVAAEFEAFRPEINRVVDTRITRLDRPIG